MRAVITQQSASSAHLLENSGAIELSQRTMLGAVAAPAAAPAAAPTGPATAAPKTPVSSENLIRWIRSRKENRIMIETYGDLLQTSARIYAGLLSFA
jgi:hypothetical protein